MISILKHSFLDVWFVVGCLVGIGLVRLGLVKCSLTFSFLDELLDWSGDFLDLMAS